MSTISWINVAGGDWNVGANWSGGAVPTASDDAVIALPGTYDISSQDASNAAHSVTLNDPDANLEFNISTLALGGPLLLNAGTFVLSGTIDGGTIVLAGGTFTAFFGSPTLSGVTIEGALTLDLPFFAPLSIDGGLVLEGAEGVGPGTIDLLGGSLDFTNTQTVSGGAIVLGQAGVLAPSLSDGAVTVGTGGTFEETGADAVAIIGTLANAGSISVANGALLDIGNPTTTTGRISETDATLRLSGASDLSTIASIRRSGGVVANFGTLSLEFAGISVGGTTTLGQLRDNGLIANGVIADAGGGMVFYGGPGSLQNVTYEGLLNLTPAASDLTVLDGLTVTGASGTGPGTANVLGAGSRIAFQGSQTFDNATLNIGSNTKADVLAVSDPTGTGAALTLGANLGVIQRGAMAEIDIDRNLGDALVNDGLIGAVATNGGLLVQGGTFSNAGKIVVANGETLSLEADRVTNLTGNVLNTGYWEVDANSTLNLGFDNPILNMNALMVLNGPGSQVLYNNTSTFKTTSLEQTLNYVGTAGVLALENGRAFNDPGLFFDSGQVVLSGGTLSGNPVAIASTGVIYGTGTITAGAIYDSGHVLANGGALVLNAPLLNGAPVGNALIAAGSTLVAEQTVAVPVEFLANTGTLALAQANLMYGTIFSFTGSDAIDMLNVNPSGVALRYAPGSGSGVLTVKTGAVTDATLHFHGSYVLANFSVTSNGHGGTLLLDPPVPAPTLTGADWKVTPGDLAPPPAGAVDGGVANAGTHAVGFGMATPQDPPSPTLLAHQ